MARRHFISWVGLMARLGLLAIAWALAPPAAKASDKANITTLYGRHAVGYQGWFGCPGDGSPLGWRHWFRGSAVDPGNLTVDMWPDTSELTTEERCPTGWTNADGTPSVLFSSQDQRTVDRHLSWMKQYGIDGLALQRFLSTLSRPAGVVERDKVLANVRSAAQRHGRGYFIMYDISGADPARWTDMLRADWERLVAAGVTRDTAYWRHRGAPVLAIWGPGFRDRPGTAAQTLDLVKTLKAMPGGVTIVGGVPSGWRTLDQDAKPEPEWREAYAAFDVISPWTVGRYIDPPSWARQLNRVEADLAALKPLGRDYLPVVFPGYSFRNARRGEESWFDRIPRRCGAFYAMQTADLVGRGYASMMYTAMFDEVDEATAIMKVASKPDEAPTVVPTVTLDRGGCALPSDWYLRLAGEATRALAARVAGAGGVPGRARAP